MIDAIIGKALAKNPGDRFQTADDFARALEMREDETPVLLAKTSENVVLSRRTLGAIIAALVILQLYVVRWGWWIAIAYSLLLIIAPLIYLLIKLRKASGPQDYALLSNISKLIMLSGILSILFFRLYF